MQKIHNFIDVRFPVSVSYKSHSVVEYLTNIVTMFNGSEQRNIEWEKARMRFHIARGLYNQEEMEKLRDFFRICRGKATAFRFKDWTDYNLKRERVVILNDRFPLSFKLQKIYSFDQYLITRNILKPVKKTIKLYYENGEKITEWDFFDNGTGVISVGRWEDMNILVDCEFDVPVRFNTDSLQFVIEDDGIYSCNAVDLVEVR